MMHYAWDFSQSETERYFEWIISHFISWKLFLVSFSVLWKPPFLHPQWRRSFSYFWGVILKWGTARNTFKVGMFCCVLFTAGTVAQYCLERVPWCPVRECFISPFSSQYNVTKRPIVGYADCRLSFICSKKATCGQVVTCKCCCLSNVFTLFVSNVSELLQYKKSTWWAKTKNRDPLYGNSL